MLGYRQPGNSCMIYCGDDCRAFSQGDFYKKHIEELEIKPKTDWKKIHEGAKKKKLDEVEPEGPVLSSKRKKLEALKETPNTQSR